MMLGGVVSLIINIRIAYWMTQQFYGLAMHTSYGINTYNDIIDFE